MKFHQYSDIAQAVRYPDADLGTNRALTHLSVGLLQASREIGEAVAQLLAAEASGGVSTGSTHVRALHLLGDLLWHVDRMAHELGSELDVVANNNLDLLLDHKLRGVLPAGEPG